MEKKMDEKVYKKLGKMGAWTGLVTYETVKLREVDDLEMRLDDNGTIAKSVAQRANLNEQYLWKNNVKITRVEKEGNENEDSTVKKLKRQTVSDFLGKIR